MEAGIVIGVIIAIGAIAFIWYKVAASYNAKVAEALAIFISAAAQFKTLVGMHFVVETNNKKIKTWDRQHKIDFIINHNIKQIVDALEKFNDLEVWWQGSMPKAKESALSRARFLASNMMVFGNSFRSRVIGDLDRLVATYNPETMRFLLKTYTHLSNTRHYNPHTGEWWADASPDKTTFSILLNPSELLERIDILAQYNFQMTEYQYECDDQRKLMTAELRQRIIERDKGICQNCKKKCGYGEIEIDHIQPVSKGGKTIASNLQVLCVNCNRSKSNKWLEEIKHDFGHIRFVDDSEPPKQVTPRAAPQRPKVVVKNPYYGNGVKVGKFVKIRYMDTNEETAFQIVADWDADSFKKRISISSPVGSALLGQKENDIVTATTPSGKVKLQIVEISDSEIGG